MPSVYHLKPAFQGLLRPLVRKLAGARVTANQVTVAAVLLSAAQGAAIVIYPDNYRVLLGLPIILFVRMALNAIDGMLAREHAMKSKLGAILNELGDVVSDAALYLPLALVPGFDPGLVVTIVVLAIIGEMTGVVTQTLGASRRYDGPFGKSDRAFAFAILGLLLGLGLGREFWLEYVLVVMVFLAVWTVINRARRGLLEART